LIEFEEIESSTHVDTFS